MIKILLLGLGLISFSFASDLTLSEADEKKQKKREKLFGDWTSIKEIVKQINKVDNQDKYPLFFETNEKEQIRVLYFDNEEMGRIIYNQWLDLENLKNDTTRFATEGPIEYVLVAAGESLPAGNQDRYWALWVEEGYEKSYYKVFRRLGITKAVLKPSEPATEPSK